jgi:hypothetical protein
MPGRVQRPARTVEEALTGPDAPGQIPAKLKVTGEDRLRQTADMEGTARERMSLLHIH